MSNDNRINERLRTISAGREAINTNKKDVLNGIMSQEEERPDFSAIAAELEERNEKEAKGENEGYIKDTIYIEESIYKAFNALCLRRGDKKKLVNEALSDFVLKKHKELKNK